MDFFEAQARARRRTGRLVFLFCLAVLGTVVAGYAFALVILSQVGGPGGFWLPQVFIAVAAGSAIVIGLASAAKWARFRAGGSAVAESVGGRLIQPGSADPAERRLLNVVEEMAIASGVPVPGVYLLSDEPSINAFAAGLTTGDAVVAVTRGTLEKLSRDELQGVVAHEFSHILNGDMRLNVHLTAILFGILVIGLAGRGILRSMGRGRVRVGGGRNKGGGIALVLAVGFALLVVGYVGYFFGRLIQAAVSRQREFLADASGVQFTRNPDGLTGALKKIGGYALGSRLQTGRATAIGHFFFAQAFRSHLGGFWATHPPLPERIRAIDPSFDGRFHEPPEVVDVASEPWGRPGRPEDIAGFAPGALARASPVAAIASAGNITPNSLAMARSTLAGLDATLLAAARDPERATALVYAILVESEPAGRSRQQQVLRSSAGSEDANAAGELCAQVEALKPGDRLPLVQIALQSLRELRGGKRETFLHTLDELVHADQRVSPLEFALQRLVIRHLDLASEPTRSISRYHSFHAVAHDIAIVLSTIAHAASATTQRAFECGRVQLPVLAKNLPLLPPEQCGFGKLDAALDRLALATPPIKQRVLVAVAHAAGADGDISVEEEELLRAVSAALDVPVPPSARPA
jgi:Zn-dependent protease with chaperone function/uncharacterized tellurite resistance protein B-like protein